MDFIKQAALYVRPSKIDTIVTYSIRFFISREGRGKFLFSIYIIYIYIN